MDRRTTQHTLEERLVTVLRYEKGQASVNQLARQLGISKTTIRGPKGITPLETIFSGSEASGR